MIITVSIKNNNKSIEIPQGTSLHEIVKNYYNDAPYPILGALVNNKLKELNFRVFEPLLVEFIDITNLNGKRLYLRSLSFVLYKAVKDIFPKAVLKIEHSVSKGYFFYIEKMGRYSETKLHKIKQQMNTIIEADLPFQREKVLTQNAIQIFENAGMKEKAILFKTRKRLYTSIYKLGDSINYFFGYLVPSTAYLKVFDLIKYNEGFLIVLPSKEKPELLEKVVKQEKLYNIFREHKTWIKILEVPYIGNLNEAVNNNNISELIKISEALHEKKIASIADLICKKNKKVKVILISGPSSSGKTSFSKRLAIQLRVLGKKSFQLSLDDFFLDREETPLDENGDYNFETIDAINLDLFNTTINKLMNGESVNLPKFNFALGQKVFSDEKTKLQANTFIIVEGIHALNPKLTSHIDHKAKFKIFVSALTQISIDAQNPIPSTDNRLIRRIVRDYQYRGYSALDTLKRWPSVKKGEEKYIFPYQENADIMFNSALLYELAVLKNMAENILKDVPENQPQNAEAVRLLKFLSYFLPAEYSKIPFNSILREFLGGSSFKY
ncbi:MAG: nucleoside kinase [Bacteroidales bacterium]|nr:nucleoside kinase [Bacteroidales bacterium]